MFVLLHTGNKSTTSHKLQGHYGCHEGWVDLVTPNFSFKRRTELCTRTATKQIKQTQQGPLIQQSTCHGGRKTGHFRAKWCPNGAEMGPNGAKWHPKGAQMVPKGGQKVLYPEICTANLCAMGCHNLIISFVLIQNNCDKRGVPKHLEHN